MYKITEGLRHEVQESSSPYCRQDMMAVQGLGAAGLKDGQNESGVASLWPGAAYS